MAFDLLLMRETNTNWSRENEKAPLPLVFTPGERLALKLLEPSTAAHVVEVLGWARGRGIPAQLSDYAVIYTPEMAAEHYAAGRSGIKPGRIDWHQVGRAYHLKGPKGYLTDDEYARIAAYARSQGGEWLGDKIVVGAKGKIKDIAHYEYHPNFDIATYRKMPLAQVEYDKAQARARRFT